MVLVKKILPNKVFAVAAKRRLLEKPSNELMVFNIEIIFLPQSAASGKLLRTKLFIAIVPDID